MKTNNLLATLLASSAFLLGCGDGMGSGVETGTLTVRLADAPGEEVESAVIWVSRVSVVGEDGGIHVISNDTATYDLLALQGGVTAGLGSAEIPVGTYNQLRLLVDSAQVTLKAPVTFTSGSSTASLKVPSGSTSGLKVNLDNVSVVPGETVLLVDFDVSRSFVFQGPPGGPKSASFKPVIHATVMDVAGSIAGTVLSAVEQGGALRHTGARHHRDSIGRLLDRRLHDSLPGARHVQGPRSSNRVPGCDPRQHPCRELASRYGSGFYARSVAPDQLQRAPPAGPAGAFACPSWPLPHPTIFLAKAIARPASSPAVSVEGHISNTLLLNVLTCR